MKTTRRAEKTVAMNGRQSLFRKIACEKVATLVKTGRKWWVREAMVQVEQEVALAVKGEIAWEMCRAVLKHLKMASRPWECAVYARLWEKHGDRPFVAGDTSDRVAFRHLAQDGLLARDGEKGERARPVRLVRNDDILCLFGLGR